MATALIGFGIFCITVVGLSCLAFWLNGDFEPGHGTPEYRKWN